MILKALGEKSQRLQMNTFQFRWSFANTYLRLTSTSQTIFLTKKNFTERCIQRRRKQRNNKLGFNIITYRIFDISCSQTSNDTPKSRFFLITQTLTRVHARQSQFPREQFSVIHFEPCMPIHNYTSLKMYIFNISNNSWF